MNLYKPLIIKKEIDSEHYYYVDGLFFPSVTKILGDTLPTPYALRKWIGDVGTERAESRLQKAGDRGSAIHDACERLLMGKEVRIYDEFSDPKDRKCVASFVKFFNDFKPVVEEGHIEFTVASRLGYAGTLDIFCHINNEPYIIDIKTSGNIYDSHYLQITAYQNAFLEMTGIMPKRAILHLNPLTKIGYSFHEDIKIKDKEITVDDFKLVFEMYKMLNGGVVPEPPIVDVYPEIINLFERLENDS